MHTTAWAGCINPIISRQESKTDLADSPQTNAVVTQPHTQIATQSAEDEDESGFRVVHRSQTAPTLVTHNHTIHPVLRRQSLIGV
jgi:hypothetical protein